MHCVPMRTTVYGLPVYRDYSTRAVREPSATHAAARMTTYGMCDTDEMPFANEGDRSYQLVR